MPGPKGKLIYRPSEVAELLDIPLSTIRYWCAEFEDFLNLSRPLRGHRRFREKDIAKIELLRTLMHEKGMSIEGAKKHLELSRLPSGGYKCESAETALNLLREATKMVQDVPKARTMINAVIRWIKSNQSS